MAFSIGQTVSWLGSAFGVDPARKGIPVTPVRLANVFTQRATSSIVHGMGSTLSSSPLDVLKREISYHVNRATPNVVPEPAQVIGAYYARMVPAGIVEDVLGYHGIYWREVGLPVDASNTRKAWANIVNLSRPTLDLSQNHDMWLQGNLTDDEYVRRLHREGLNDADVSLVLSQNYQPSVPEAMSLWQQGKLSNEEAVEAYRRNGIKSPAWHEVLLSQWQPFNPSIAVAQFHLGKFSGEDVTAYLNQAGMAQGDTAEDLLNAVAPFDPATAVSLGYRGHLDPIEVDSHLKANGYTDPEWRRAYTLGSRYLPGPADLVTFAVRDVWQADVVERFQYDAEFPQPFAFWMEKTGANWSEDIPNPDGTVTPGIPWPVAYWRAHWQLMSPTQGAEAVHRLRPDRIWRYRNEIPDITPYTFRDQETLLKTADYPLPMRRWLAALTFLPLRLADIHTAYLRGVRGRAWAVDQLRDRGYVEDDARVAVETWDAQEEWRQDAPMRGLEQGMRAAMVREVIGGYTDGLIDRASAFARLDDLLVKPTLRDQLLALAETRAYRRTANLYLRQIQREYLDGSISPAELAPALSRAGLPIAAQANLAARWNAIRSTRRRALASGQILALLRQRVLSPAQALQRLTNLGWVGGDALLQVQAVRRTLTLQQQRLAQQQGRQRETRRRQAAATARQARAVAKAARSELRSLYPRAEMRRWMAKGIASEEFVRARLAEQGWSPDYVNRWIDDAKSKATGNGRKKKETGPSGSPGTGTGTPGT